MEHASGTDVFSIVVVAHKFSDNDSARSLRDVYPPDSGTQE
jgi:hypothetical protein